MTPHQRQRLIDAISDVVPEPVTGCADCDPSGGCANPVQCRRYLAETITAIVEREIGA
jgi:hypothetical protein